MVHRINKCIYKLMEKHLHFLMNIKFVCCFLSVCSVYFLFTISVQRGGEEEYFTQ